MTRMCAAPKQSHHGRILSCRNCVPISKAALPVFSINFYIRFSGHFQSIMCWLKIEMIAFHYQFWKLFENDLYANQEEIGLKAAQPLTVHRKTASCDWAHNLRCTDTNQGLHSHIHVQKSWSSLFIQSQIICYVSCQCVWKSINTIIEYFNIDYATIFNIFFFKNAAVATNQCSL